MCVEPSPKVTPLIPAETLPQIVVIAGPTAVGKTGLGVEIASRFNGEVVNADSRYLYRGFDIGTAKPTIEERRGIPHHLIDILGPADDFSLARYQELAYSAIASVRARGKLPLLVGGTPLYVNAVIEGWKIPRVPPHPEIRARLEREVEANGLGTLSLRLAEVDPDAAVKCGTNPRRIIRALEIYEVTGLPMSSLEGKGPRPYDTLEIGLRAPREVLHQRIDARVEKNVTDGLVTEVEQLLASGIDSDAPAMSSIGYRQLLPYIDGEQSLEAAIERIKLDTHRYVRHQETWLRSNPRLIPIDTTQPGWIDRCAALVSSFLAGESVSK